MSWAIVAGAAISTVGGAMASSKAKKGAQAGADAQMAGIEEQRRQYDQSRQDMMPFLDFGKWAIPQQQAFLNGDWSGFEKSPDYLYAKEQGLDAIDHRAAARGGLFGGGNTRDAMTFASGLATQNADNYWNKLAGISGQGQAVGNSLGQLGGQMANSIQQGYGNIGIIRQGAYNNQANMYGNVGSGLAGAFGDWYGNQSTKNGGGSGWYLGNNPGKG